MILSKKFVSSDISEARYDTIAHTMTIKFPDTGDYQYDAVPNDIFNGICNAEHPGVFFLGNIKAKFAWVKL